MVQAPADVLYSYWSSLRGQSAAPGRFDVEPGQIAGILADTFILQKISGQSYRYRIAGTRLCDIVDRELRDTDFLDGWRAADSLALARALAAVTQRAAVVRFTMEVEQGSYAGHNARSPSGVASDKATFEGILLPLLHTNGRLDRIIGTLAPKAPPDWLGCDPATAPRLITLTIEPSLADATGRHHAAGRRTPFAHSREPLEGKAVDRFTEVRARFEALSTTAERSGVDNLPGDRQSPFPQHIRKSRIVRSDRRQFRVYDGGLTSPDE